MAAPTGVAQKRYEVLSSIRDPYLRRARDAAKLTIPALMPPNGSTGSTEFYTPFQSVGAEGVNTLAAKLNLTLFPPNRPPMKLGLPAKMAVELEQGGDKGAKLKGELEATLALIEQHAVKEMESHHLRTPLFEAFRQLIAAGNVLIHADDELRLRVFKLDQYVTRRTPKGDLLELVVREEIAPELIPEGVRADAGYKAVETEHSIPLFTHIKREFDQYRVYQEALGHVVPGTEGSYPLDYLPWYALRWRRMDGEHFGRGHIEEYIGDLSSLEGLSQAVVEGSQAAAKMITLVAPNGQTNQRDIAEAPNLAVRPGRKEDVTTVTADKYGDFRVAMETSDKIERRLSRAFLLTSSVTRDAERVTAEEIKLLAADLEDALGGVYSLLATDLQLPVVRFVLRTLTLRGELPPLPQGISLTVTAGMEALGRGVSLNQWMTFASVMQRVVGPEAFMAVVDQRAFANEIGADIGVNIKRILKSPEQIAAEQNQARLDARQAALGPAAIQANAKLDEAALQQKNQ